MNTDARKPLSSGKTSVIVKLSIGTAAAVVMAGCGGTLGTACHDDVGCRRDLVCHEQMCVPPMVRDAAREKAASKALAKRVREYMGSTLAWTPEEASRRLCVAGETVIIVKDRVNGMVFCLQPAGEGFEVIDFRTPLKTGEPPCGGKVPDLVLGDIINVCLD